MSLISKVPEIAKLRPQITFKAKPGWFQPISIACDGDLIVLRSREGWWTNIAREFNKGCYGLGGVQRRFAKMLRLCVTVGLITSKQLRQHMADVAAADRQSDHDYAEKQVKRLAEKLGYSLTKKKERRAGRREC